MWIFHRFFLLLRNSTPMQTVVKQKLLDIRNETGCVVVVPILFKTGKSRLETSRSAVNSDGIGSSCLAPEGVRCNRPSLADSGGRRTAAGHRLPVDSDKRQRRAYVTGKAEGHPAGQSRPQWLVSVIMVSIYRSWVRYTSKTNVCGVLKRKPVL